MIRHLALLKPRSNPQIFQIFLTRHSSTTTESNTTAVPLSYSHSPPPQSVHPSSTTPQLPPLVILHGLFGSKQNWSSLSKSLSKQLNTDVCALDLRNHGDSTHSEIMDYESMANDVVRWMNEMSGKTKLGQKGKWIVMGHSMGGKVAMEVALRSSGKLDHEDSNKSKVSVDRLVVVDMAPVDMILSSAFPKYIEVMQQIEEAGVKKQSEADHIMKNVIPEPSIRHFLLTNLKRPTSTSTHSPLKFRIPLSTIARSLPSLGSFPLKSSNMTYTKPTLFLGGSKSDYIRPSMKNDILKLFPNATMEWIDGAGHWVHSERPGEFVKAVTEFLKSDSRL
ncbi:Alpha/Beta hydrolase protein [Paraphysoderma sedebokerense]|nr:Alpha/Beta hydrolase protein [Paraphysoderma sedebokerense]